MTLIAEDLMLLMLDDNGRTVVDRTKLPRGLAGAVLLELAIPGAIRVSEKGESVKAGRLVVVPEVASTLQPDPITTDALESIGSGRPIKAQRAVEKLQRGLRETLLARLVGQGTITAEHDRVLGVFPRTVYPAVDSTRRNALYQELRGVLVDGLEPRPRAAALVSLLSATGAVEKVFTDADKRAVKKRAKAIAEGEWAGAAVRKAIDAVNAAVVAAVVVASTSAGSSS
ncbi:GOLPH3/VPS74 family protein [Antrihabitans cavernicola]|uniref:GPP34 family phosphoprotein n=1 Tax=Antrihabitans cavernicola TaxID=2495913 RepID=A0A5A7S9G8_9NOCA|nr:GPP34 family phosphoprotein [Spelaeibacter cavernicola]KAA0021185.1 GPP34 family phosphoprotein [Spelaeibacter cavernicola]